MNKGEIEELAEKIEREIPRTEREKLSRICAVTLIEIKKEKLDFFSLFKKVKRQYEFGENVNVDENTFGQALGILLREELVDSEIDKKDLTKKPLWKLAEKGKKFLQEEIKKAKATRETTKEAL